MKQQVVIFSAERNLTAPQQYTRWRFPHIAGDSFWELLFIITLLSSSCWSAIGRQSTCQSVRSGSHWCVSSSTVCMSGITLSRYALRFVKLCRTRTQNSLSQSKAVWEQIWKSTQVYKNAGRPDKGRLFASRGKTFLSRVWYHCRL